MIKEHPILFQTDMVKAILEGRKTMTRRVVSPRNSTCGSLLTGDGQGWQSFDFNDVVVDGIKSDYWYMKVAVPEDGTRHRIFNRIEVGDHLWVRETFVKACLSEDGEGPIDGETWKYYYRADNNWTNEEWHHPDKEGPQPGPRWKPSIFMPKEAARIWLKVTGIKVERLQDITDGDVAKEGIVWNEPLDFKRDKRDCNSPAQRAFRKLWDKINGAESWNENPWVWCISFKRVRI